MKPCGDPMTIFPQPSVMCTRWLRHGHRLQIAEDVGDMVADGLAGDGLPLGISASLSP